MKVGSKAPGFRLSDDADGIVSLAEFLGRRVVLFFYPKDDTAGCTVEVCEFRDRFPEFVAENAVVLGVSPDPVRKHTRFRAKHSLPYRLLSDPDHRVCESYDVWHEKLFWGRRYMGVVRSTFVVGVDGRIEMIWRNVDHQGHAAEVSAWLRGEGESSAAPAAPRGPTRREPRRAARHE